MPRPARRRIDRDGFGAAIHRLKPHLVCSTLDSCGTDPIEGSQPVRAINSRSRRHAVSRPLDDELLAPRDSLSELIGMITPDDIRLPRYNECWSFDVAKIACSVVGLRLPHLDDLTMDHRPMGWIRCEKSIKRRRRGSFNSQNFWELSALICLFIVSIEPKPPCSTRTGRPFPYVS